MNITYVTEIVIKRFLKKKKKETTKILCQWVTEGKLLFLSDVGISASKTLGCIQCELYIMYTKNSLAIKKKVTQTMKYI